MLLNSEPLEGVAESAREQVREQRQDTCSDGRHDSADDGFLPLPPKRQRIVDLANALLGADPTTSGRRMRAHRSGGEVISMQFADIDAEARWIANDIAAQLSTRQPWEIAILSPTGWRVDQLVHMLSASGAIVSDWRAGTHSDHGRQLLRACLALLRSRLPSRQERRLCELMGIPVTRTADSSTFLRSHASHPIAAGLVDMRSMAFKAARPADLVAHIYAVVESYDGQRARSLATLVEAVHAFQERDSGFTVDTSCPS